MTDDESLKWEGDREEGMKFEEELKITRQVSFMREEEGNDEKNDEKRRNFIEWNSSSDQMKFQWWVHSLWLPFFLVSETKTHLNEQRCTQCLLCLIIPFSLSCCPYFLSIFSLLDSCVMTWEREEKRGWKRERGWKEEIDRQRERQATSSWNTQLRDGTRRQETSTSSLYQACISSFLSFRHTIRIMEAVLA